MRALPWCPPGSRHAGAVTTMLRIARVTSDDEDFAGARAVDGWGAIESALGLKPRARGYATKAGLRRPGVLPMLLATTNTSSGLARGGGLRGGGYPRSGSRPQPGASAPGPPQQHRPSRQPLTRH